MIQLNIYALLAIVQLLILLIVLVVVLWVQGRNARRQLAAARAQARTPPTAAVAAAPSEAQPELSYADYLQQQLTQSNQLLGEQIEAAGALDAVADSAPGQSSNDESTQVRLLLAARHQFLQLELDNQQSAAERDNQGQRQQLVNGMRALLEALRDKTMASTASNAPAAEGLQRAQRPESETLHEQIGYLRSVVDNQHAVMRELRELLQSYEGDSDSVQAVLNKLDQADQQFAQATQTRAGGQAASSDAVEITSAAEAADTEKLRDLVSGQQQTIAHLQQMLKQMSPTGQVADDLHRTIDKMQRTSNELNSCVMLLEDENQMLRDKVDSLQAQLQNLPATAALTVTPERTPEQTPQEAIAAAKDLASEADEPPASTSAPVTPVAADKPKSLTQGAAEQDDIDALLEQASQAPSKPAPGTPAAADKPKSLTQGAAEQDDIDALLEQASQPPSKPAPAPPTAADKPKSITQGAAEQDDIDALLEQASQPPSKPVSAPPAAADKPKSITQGAAEQDDIDALLEQASQPPSKPAPAPPAAADKPKSITQGAAEQDDIDALLEQASQPPSKPASAPPAAADKAKSNTQGEAEQDDIDALLKEILGEDSEQDRDNKG